MANDLIVDTGLNEILKRLLGLSASGGLYLAVGSANIGPTGANTELAAETARLALTTWSVTDNVATVKAFFNTSQANGIIGEHGLLTAASAGVLIDRGIEAPIQTKTATQEMIVEKVITLERG